MIHLVKAFQLIFGTHKDIALSWNKPSQWKDKKWICFHWVCGFNMHSSTCIAYKHYTISLQFFSAFFMINETNISTPQYVKRGWINKSLSWKFCHFLCAKFTSMTSADYAFVDDTSYDTVSTNHPETWVS